MQWIQSEPKYGDMIRVKVKFYYHYGIYADENNVIGFGLPDNGNTPPDDIEVVVTDISAFSCGEFIEIAELSAKEKLKRRSREKTVKTAMSRVGEKGYNILSNNCEHFATYCVFGEKKSFLDSVRADIRKKLNI